MPALLGRGLPGPGKMSHRLGIFCSWLGLVWDAQDVLSKKAGWTVGSLQRGYLERESSCYLCKPRTASACQGHVLRTLAQHSTRAQHSTHASRVAPGEAHQVCVRVAFLGHWELSFFWVCCCLHFSPLLIDNMCHFFKSIKLF